MTAICVSLLKVGSVELKGKQALHSFKNRFKWCLGI